MLLNMSTFHSKSSSSSDLIWDTFVASLHRVWEYAPDFSPTGPISLSGRHVFIIDGGIAEKEQLGDQLKRVGFTVTMIDSIEPAIRKLSEQIFDLVVIGAESTDEKTLDFCRLICDATSTMNVPIILLTNDDRPEMVRQARLAGAKFYLRKPYDPYVLLTLISVALEPIE